jgi:hypothetical protein
MSRWARFHWNSTEIRIAGLVVGAVTEVFEGAIARDQPLEGLEVVLDFPIRIFMWRCGPRIMNFTKTVFR